MPKQASLSPTHWKAIELIQEGKFSLKQVAITVGLRPDTIYKLRQGHESAGGTGQLFHAQLQELSRKKAETIKFLFIDSQYIAMQLVNDYLRRKNSQDYVSDHDIRLILAIGNLLARVSPYIEQRVHPTSNGNKYVGLSEEDMMHEFNRLTSLIRGTHLGGKPANTEPNYKEGMK